MNVALRSYIRLRRVENVGLGYLKKDETRNLSANVEGTNITVLKSAMSVEKRKYLILIVRLINLILVSAEISKEKMLSNVENVTFQRRKTEKENADIVELS